MLQFFSISALSLWKAMLLRKRVMMYTPVPLGSVCERVHSACSLAFCSSAAVAALTAPNPLFYVSVADIGELSTMPTFIACTTERIFEEKKGLYDVFVNNQNIIVNPDCQKALKITKGDHKRLLMLKEIFLAARLGQDAKRLESELQSCFTYLNDTLFQTLMESSRCGRRVESKDLPEFGLHKSDRQFLSEMITAYKLQLELLTVDSNGTNCSIL